jgi:polygalacturonase
MIINQYNISATERISPSNTLGSKLNVVDFGAVPDDGFDDRPSFQTAINRADREEVTTIYIPYR